MIVHICPRQDWEGAGSRYRAASLDTEGFIHCSDLGTVHLPADRLYGGREDLVLLEVDPARLDVPLRWEPAEPAGSGGSAEPAGSGGSAEPGGPWFPHVYGPIPRHAVVGVHDFPPGPDGRFRLPGGLAAREV